MKINLIPIRNDEDKITSLEVVDDAIIINGIIELDFSKLKDGQILPQSAVKCDFIAGDIKRENGELIIPILFSYGFVPLNPPKESEIVTHPKQINIKENGPVSLPVWEYKE